MMSPPRVQKYCIMSMKDAFTGKKCTFLYFHIFLEFYPFQISISILVVQAFGTIYSKEKKYFTLSSPLPQICPSMRDGYSFPVSRKPF